MSDEKKNIMHNTPRDSATANAGCDEMKETP